MKNKRVELIPRHYDEKLVEEMRHLIKECQFKVEKINHKINNISEIKDEQLKFKLNKPIKIMSRLVMEERGVAAFKYKNLINDITNYINSNIFNEKFLTSSIEQTTKKGSNYYVNSYELIVPSEYTNQIIETKKLTIKVIAEDYIYKFKIKKPYSFFNIKLGGSYETIDNTNSFLNEALITIHITAFNNKFNEHKTFTHLLHELQHLIEESNRVKNNRQNIQDCGIANQKILEYVLKYYFKNADESNALSNILYILFKPYELSATCSEVYSYLKSIKSTRSNFQKDIINSEAYKKFYKLKNYDIAILESYKEWQWWGIISDFMYITTVEEVNEVFKNYKFYQEKIPMIKNFKQSLLTKAKTKLREMQKQIGKVASLYYDEQEELDTNNE